MIILAVKWASVSGSPVIGSKLFLKIYKLKSPKISTHFPCAVSKLSHQYLPRKTSLYLLFKYKCYSIGDMAVVHKKCIWAKTVLESMLNHRVSQSPNKICDKRRLPLLILIRPNESMTNHLAKMAIFSAEDERDEKLDYQFWMNRPVDIRLSFFRARALDLFKCNRTKTARASDNHKFGVLKAFFTLQSTHNPRNREIGV